MSDWKNEDEIKAELRAMTDELRRLREGLRNMVTPPQKSRPSRAFLHRHFRMDPVEPPPSVAPDTRRRRPKKPR